MSDCAISESSGNVGIAFGIVTAAGLSTTLGAALAFVMPYSRSSKNLFLAACLALAGGVMIYVSFVEIFTVKTIGEFAKCVDEEFAYLYGTLCFFGGILITAIFDRVLHAFQHWLGHRRREKITRSHPSDGAQSSSEDDASVDPCGHDVERPRLSHEPLEMPANTSSLGEPVEIDDTVGHDGHFIASLYNQDAETQARESAKLIRMGIFAGIALAFHNFPEGLATFVSVLEDPSVGASVAIAIGIHNIPEGVCVAMPIYYATGSRVKSFVWATLSGLTELVGAVLGWVVLRNVITPTIYAILFGVVAGMMIYISFKELIPTAHRYDPDDQVTSICIVVGMIVMAISLVLFKF